MREVHEQLDTILQEAIVNNFDQLVVVSRSDESHLYLLAKGRVKKGITFQTDIAGAFTEYFAEKPYEMNETAAAGLGKCYSVKIREK
jgi:hypothetical protein